MPSVLFVCTGNLCRSPMAAALFKDLLTASGSVAWWQVDSAGTWAPNGFPATYQTRAVLKQRGLDISQHRSKQVTSDLLRANDIVLVMEPGHRESLRAEFPEFTRRVHLLTELSGTPYSLEEPVEKDLAAYGDLCDELRDVLERGYERIMGLAEAGKPTHKSISEGGVSGNP